VATSAANGADVLGASWLALAARSVATWRGGVGGMSIGEANGVAAQAASGAAGAATSA
jgi:hypothetical protein